MYCFDRSRRLSAAHSLFIGVILFHLSSATTVAATFSKWINVEQDVLQQFSHAAVTYIQRTSNGNLWIGTEEALHLHDGNASTRFRVPLSNYPHIPASRYIGMFELPGKTILVTKNDGLFSLASGTKEFVRFQVDGPFEEVKRISQFALTEQRAFSLILSDDNLYIIDFASQRSYPVSNFDDSENPPLTLIGHGRAFYVVFLNGEVKTINVKSNLPFLSSLEPCSPGTQQEVVAASIFDGDIVLFDKSLHDSSINISDGVCGSPKEDIRFRSMGNRARVKSATQLPLSNAISLLTSEGLYLYKNGASTLISSTNSSLGSSDVLGVSEIAPNSILVGGFLGMAQIEYSDLFVIDYTELEDEPEFTAITAGDSNTVYVATTRAIYRLGLNDELVEFDVFSDLGSKARITAIEFWDKKLWVGLADGELRMVQSKNKTKKCLAPSELTEGAPITSFSASPQNGSLNVSTLAGRIISFSSCTTAEVVNLVGAKKPSAPLIQISILDPTTSWIFDFDGAYRLELTSSPVTEAKPFTSQVKSFVPRLWGLRKNSSDIYFYSAEGLLSKINIDDADTDLATEITDIGEPIYSMEIDLSGRFWLAGKSGLWIENDLEAPAVLWRSPRSKGNPIVFDYGVSHKTKSGALLFGGANGLVVVTEPEELPSLLPTPIWISRTRIDEQASFFDRKKPVEHIELSANSADVSFTVSYDHIARPRASAIDLYLEGVDQVWHQSMNGESAKYSKLPPGNYTFRARGAGPEGVWSENEIALPIVVKPPFWRTYWAYSFYAVFLIWAATLIKRINDHRVVQADRLAHARETEVAFNRLEDSAQLHRDLAHRQLKHRKTHSLVVLNIVTQVKEVLAAPESTQHETSSMVLEDYIAALSCAEKLAHRSMSGDTLDLASFANEHFSLLVSRNIERRSIVFINDVSEMPIPLSTALQIVPVMQEALTFLVDSFAATSHNPPTLQLHLNIAPLGRDGSSELKISAAADPTNDVSELQVSNGFPVSYHLIESLGGELEYSWGTKLSLTIRLTLPTDTTGQND